MSSSNLTDRPKLKARRNNNNHYGQGQGGQFSRDYYEEDRGNSRRQGSKRTYKDEDYKNNRTRTPMSPCTSGNAPRNIAQNRLQKLRVDINNSIDNSVGPPKKAKCEDLSTKKPSPKILGSPIVIESSPPPKKNLANERLKNVRKSVEKVDKLIDSEWKKSSSIQNRLSLHRLNSHTSANTSSNKNETKQVQKMQCSKVDGKNLEVGEENALENVKNVRGDVTPTPSQNSNTIDLTLMETPPIPGISPLLQATNSTSSVRTESPLEVIEVDRNDFTNSWLNNNQPAINLNKVDTNSSLTVNVNDSVADFRKINPMDQSEDMEWDVSYQNINNVEEARPPVPKPKETNKIKNLCIIVDTNILVHYLNKVEDILLKRFSGPHKPIVFIPWMVIEELDHLKDKNPDPKVRQNAFIASRFINQELVAPHPRIIGQTVLEMRVQKDIGVSPDDKIISCCLQAMENYEDIILLSMDINLKNKALINSICACSAHEAMIKIVTKIRKNIKSQKIMTKMGLLCSSVISDCAKEIYGNAWSKMDLLKNPPWTLTDCMRRFQRYQKPIFRDKLLKQFTKTVDQLDFFLSQHNFICDDSDEFDEFVKRCLSLCIYLKDIKECRGIVDNVMDDIVDIAEN